MSKKPLYGSLVRQFKGPLEDKYLFNSLEELTEYINSDTTAFEGMLCFINNNIYILKEANGQLYPSQLIDIEELNRVISQYEDILGNKKEYSTIEDLNSAILNNEVNIGSLCYVGQNNSGDLYLIVEDDGIHAIKLVEYLAKTSSVQQSLSEIWNIVNNEWLDVDISESYFGTYEHIVVINDFHSWNDKHFKITIECGDIDNQEFKNKYLKDIEFKTQSSTIINVSTNSIFNSNNGKERLVLNYNNNVLTVVYVWDSDVQLGTGPRIINIKIKGD